MDTVMSGVEQRSRREVLAGVAAGTAGLGGCVTAFAGRDAPEPVSLLVAGSLHHAVEDGLIPALSAPARVEAAGSARVARLVASGKRAPDVVSLADTALFSGVIAPDWYAGFATNAVVLAYDPDTPGGRRIERAAPENWYRPLLSGDVRLGRTDPDLDPLGYRTLFVLDLAGEYYDTARDLRAVIPRRRQLYPETRIASAFETGEIEAAFLYRSTAIDRGYPFISFPPAIDLHDPDFGDAYAEAAYTLPSGTTVRGGPIVYGGWARTDGPRVRETFDRHVRGEYLADFGFAVPEGLPRFAGDVPDWVR
jgi:molybdate/tungstate transport system substrate-binding protein